MEMTMVMAMITSIHMNTVMAMIKKLTAMAMIMTTKPILAE